MIDLRPGSDVSLWQNETCLLRQLHIPRGVLQRGIGLMFRKKIPAAFGSGLFFPRCRSLHTFWMRFPLDVCFLDAEGQVVNVQRSVSPWRVVQGPREARHVFEVRSGDLVDLHEAPLVWRIL